MKEILLFGCRKDDDVKKLEQAFALMSIGVRRIEKEKYHCPIGQLLQKDIGTNGMGKKTGGVEILPGVPDLGALAGKSGDYQGEDLTVPVMVLSGFSEKELDSTLAIIRQNIKGTDYLKAVLTDYNRNWNVFLLASHLKEEHKKMTHKQGRPMTQI